MRINSRVRIDVLVASWIGSLILPFSALGADYPSVQSVSHDPMQLCTILDTNLPDKTNEIRKLGKLLSEVSEPDKDYCSDDCSIYEMKFSGLSLFLLEDKNTQESATLKVDVSNAKWNLLGNINVGQKLEILEKYFGVKIKPNVSPVLIEGECTRLTVWHTKGRITRLSLDCQGCI